MAINQDALLKSKIMDAADRSFKQNIYTYTPFLSISELSVFYQLEKELKFVDYSIFKESSPLERRMIQFGSSATLGYEEEFPVSLLKISPLIEKYAETLNHKDYLGALMNLGIKRELIGDIIVKDKYAFLFCINHISEFIINNLTKVKHTHVKADYCNDNSFEFEYTLEGMEVLCASTRIDAAVAGITKSSRSQALELFKEKKIYLNGRLSENNSYQLKPDDIIVIRGVGKFIYKSEGGETKKGRIYLHFERYV